MWINSVLDILHHGMRNHLSNLPHHNTVRHQDPRKQPQEKVDHQYNKTMDYRMAMNTTGIILNALRETTIAEVERKLGASRKMLGHDYG